MSTVKSQWCRKCSKRQPHEKIGSSSFYEGSPGRGLLAVTTLGFSELYGREVTWRCLICGEYRVMK